MESGNTELVALLMGDGNNTNCEINYFNHKTRTYDQYYQNVRSYVSVLVNGQLIHL